MEFILHNSSTMRMGTVTLQHSPWSMVLHKRCHMVPHNVMQVSRAQVRVSQGAVHSAVNAVVSVSAYPRLVQLATHQGMTSGNVENGSNCVRCRMYRVFVEQLSRSGRTSHRSHRCVLSNPWGADVGQAAIDAHGTELHHFQNDPMLTEAMEAIISRSARFGIQTIKYFRLRFCHIQWTGCVT